MSWDFPVKKSAGDTNEKPPETNETQACVEIHQWVNEELGRKEVGHANRASSAPQCVRKRWFQNQGIEGEPMQPRSLIVFATGDVVEHVYKYFIAKACVGPGKLYSEVDFGKKNGTFTIQHREFDVYEQETLTIRFGNGPEISGHADGWGKRNSDGEWELIEIKSSSSYGFDDFVAGDTDYVPQLHALMMSNKAKELGVKQARLFYMNKNTSAIFDRLYDYDVAIANQVWREYVVSNGPNEPSIPDQEGIGAEPVQVYNRKTKSYDSTGSHKLGWKCSYCSYNKKCFPNARLEFKGGKPIYYVEK
jgi:hypothetical protein